MIKQRCENTVTVNYIVRLNENGHLSSLGFVNKNLEISQVRGVGFVPLYLERRSHDIISELLGKEIPITGFISLTFNKDILVAAQLTPANLPLLHALQRELIFLKGRLFQQQHYQVSV